MDTVRSLTFLADAKAQKKRTRSTYEKRGRAESITRKPANTMAKCICLSPIFVAGRKYVGYCQR